MSTSKMKNKVRLIAKEQCPEEVKALIPDIRTFRRQMRDNQKKHSTIDPILNELTLCEIRHRFILLQQDDEPRRSVEITLTAAQIASYREMTEKQKLRFLQGKKDDYLRMCKRLDRIEDLEKTLAAGRVRMAKLEAKIRRNEAEIQVLELHRQTDLLEELDYKVAMAILESEL